MNKCFKHLAEAYRMPFMKFKKKMDLEVLLQSMVYILNGKIVDCCSVVFSYFKI